MDSFPNESHYFGQTGPILTKNDFIPNDVYSQQIDPPPSELPQLRVKKTLKNLPEVISSAEKPLMGMSYVFGTCVEKFCCVLCDKSFHMNLIVGHVTGNSHRMDYCVSKF